MEKLFSSLISINAVVALLFIVGYIFLFDKRSKTNRMLPVMLLGSGLWSLSNSVLIKNFDSLSSAKNCLFIEIVGIFLYVIAAQVLFLKYSNVLGLKRMLCTIIAWAGLLVAALAINPGWLENAYLNRFQNLVSFLKSKDISEVFLGYMILAVLSVFIQILGMLKASQPAKVRIFGRKFLEILVLNIVGIFFDQLFPKYSYLGFPGGVLTQFWGMLIMWDAVKSLEDVHIDAKNLADKLSKIDGAPVLFYGLEVVILGIYALLWQQVIKKYDLSIAYANKAVTLIWALLWSVILFKEHLKWNQIVGVLIVIAGIYMLNTTGKSQKISDTDDAETKEVE